MMTKDIICKKNLY